MQKMSKNSMAATAVGIATATAAVGAAAYLMNSGSKSARRRAMKKNARKAMKTVGHAVGTAVDSMASNILG